MVSTAEEAFLKPRNNITGTNEEPGSVSHKAARVCVLLIGKVREMNAGKSTLAPPRTDIQWNSTSRHGNIGWRQGK